MHSLIIKLCATMLLVLLIGLSLGQQQVMAQTDNLVLPDGFGINQIQTTENLSSGVLNINLPIESFLVPVSISYSTSGIRVSERAGVVGLGWNLNAGGFVARQKRGVRDGAGNGFSGESKRGNDVAVSTSDVTFYAQAMEGDENSKWDTHPDIFYFQFGNYSGQFALNQDREVIKLTPNNLKITPNYSSVFGYQGFTIVDELGNIYNFSGVKEITTVYHDSEEQSEYSSKWPLERITNYSTGDYITFSYMSAPLYTEYVNMNWKSPGQSNFEGTTQVKTEYQNLLIEEIQLNPLFPSNNSTSKIQFHYGDRIDITSKKSLDSIIYFVKGNEQVVYNFEYRYLGEGTASRLMLSKVSKSTLDIPLYQFAYFGQNKNEHTLPEYESPDQDHWGYYNNNPINHRFDGLDGADLDPNLYRTQANTLKKIYHTAGGFEEFEYELNSYYNGSQNVDIGGLRIKKIRRGDFDGNFYTFKTFDYTNSSGNSSGDLFSEPLHSVMMNYNGTDYSQYREHSYEQVADHLGRHIVYENVAVSLLGGGRIKNTFFTFQDNDIFGSNANQNLRVSKWSGIAEIPSTYSSVHQGPFGHRSFKGNATGLLKKKETVDFADNLLSIEEYQYTPVIATDTIFGMNTSLFGSGSGDYWYNVDFYSIGNGYMRLDEVQSTTYDVNDSNKKIKTITEYTYHNTYNLPKSVKSYLDGDDSSNSRETSTTYLFEQPGSLSGVESANLLALVSLKTDKKGTQTLTSQITQYDLNNSGKIVPDRVLGYSHGPILNELVGDLSYVYDNNSDKLISTVDNMTGTQSTQFWNIDGTQIIAEFSNASPDDCAFTSFEGDEVGNWVMPAMSSSNEETGIIGQAYDLATSDITKSLTADKEYMISYWYKNGSVALTGVNTNQLIYTRTLDGWTFEERMISRTTNGDVTLSGTVHIDHLSLYPRGAMMSSYTYHDMFGKTSETDSHNNSIFYEYDEAGRVKLIKDKNLDIISSKEYKVTQYLHASWPEADVNFGGETFEILVESNGPWQVTNSSWITVSPTSGEGVGNITATISNNPNTTSRTGTITIKEDNTPSTGVPDFVIDVDQGAAPENYIVVTPSIIEIEMDPTVVVGIASNKSWTATVTNNPGNRITIQGSNTGTGDGSITISAINITGSPLSGVVTVAADDGSVNAIINVYF